MYRKKYYFFIILFIAGCIVLENKVYFETYIHYLNCLKEINPKEFPFAEQIIFMSQKMPRPLYLENKQS